eukprot:10705-Heterococcus_DN1.PRE.2
MRELRKPLLLRSDVQCGLAEVSSSAQGRKHIQAQFKPLALCVCFGCDDRTCCIRCLSGQPTILGGLASCVMSNLRFDAEALLSEMPHIH